MQMAHNFCAVNLVSVKSYEGSFSILRIFMLIASASAAAFKYVFRQNRGISSQLRRD